MYFEIGHFLFVLKAKAVSLHATKAIGGGRYSSYLFSISALDGDAWSESRPGRALAPGIGPPIPIVQEARWAPEPVWTQGLEEKSFRLCRESNLDSPAVQPVARHYTDWATRFTLLVYVKDIKDLQDAVYLFSNITFLSIVQQL
jgi:hypothetical protein